MNINSERFIEMCDYYKQRDGMLNMNIEPNAFNRAFGSTCKFISTDYRYIRSRLLLKGIYIKKRSYGYSLRTFSISVILRNIILYMIILTFLILQILINIYVF